MTGVYQFGMQSVDFAEGPLQDRLVILKLYYFMAINQQSEKNYWSPPGLLILSAITPCLLNRFNCELWIEILGSIHFLFPNAFLFLVFGFATVNYLNMILI